MQKVRIVSLEGNKAKVVAALHILGALDLRKSALHLADDRPAAYSTDISDSLIKVNGAMQLLTEHDVAHEKQVPVARLVSEVKSMKVLDDVYGLGDERKELQDDLRTIGYAEHIATSFESVRIDFGRIRSDYLALRAFETDGKGAKQFKAVSGSAEKNVEITISRSGKKKWLVLLAYEKSRDIDELIKNIKVNELDLTARYLDTFPGEVLKKARKKRSEDNKRLGEIAGRLSAISRSDYSRLANIKEMLEIELERSDVSSNFKRTESTFVVEGWVEKKKVEEVKQRMSNVTDGRAYVEEIDSGNELAPTQTHRPKFLQPFDYLVSFYSVQRSDEVDPTWIFILSFPIFYGLMVTDVGYGIASLILATLIARKTDPEGLMYNAAKVWQLNSFAAMFFGVLSNQWFGFQLLGYSAPFSFDWLKNTPELIAITVLFGVTQVLLGLLIGVYNAYHHGHKKIALAKVTSMLVVGCGTVAVAGAFFGAFGDLVTEVTGAIAIVSLLATAVLSGSEATEITNLITHPLSYARIMGFGLASVIIAFLIDMAFTPHLSSGILIFAMYLVIFIALHFLNMILAIFEGIVQGVRLNLVEFFSKFYIGNGIKFKPFRYKRVYTKE